MKINYSKGGLSDISAEKTSVIHSTYRLHPEHGHVSILHTREERKTNTNIFIGYFDPTCLFMNIIKLISCFMFKKLPTVISTLKFLKSTCTCEWNLKEINKLVVGNFVAINLYTHTKNPKVFGVNNTDTWATECSLACTTESEMLSSTWKNAFLGYLGPLNINPFRICV